jgi:RNA polymerase sigma factor (sigma-70 family)
MISAEITGSIQQQCTIRLENLYKNSHIWLIKASYNITGNSEDAADLVQDLYQYLLEKCNPKLFYLDSYNLLYLHRFLTHRWINRRKKNSRMTYVGEIYNDDPAEEYDVERDEDIMRAYGEVMEELQRLKKTKGWASARLFELYWCSDDTLQEVADKIGISKSTVFIAIRKIRKHMATVIHNPNN